MLFLIVNILSFAEVPHSYVTENPKKEVQKVETFKQREKAELNLSVTKLKTKEIEGKLVNGKLVFDITDKKDIQEGNILVTQGTPYKPNNARIRSVNPTQILEATKEANRLEVTGENLQDVYINILNSKGQLVGIYSDKIQPRDDIYNEIWKDPGYINFQFTEEYDSNTYISINNNVKGTSQSEQPKGIIRGSDNLVWEEWILWKVQEPIYVHLNDVPIKIAPHGHDSHGNFIPSIETTIVNIAEDLVVEFSGGHPRYKFRLLKYPSRDFTLDVKTTGNLFERTLRVHREHHLFNFEYKVLTLRGDSTLTFNEYYPVNEFVQFTANPTIQNALPLALDNSVKDVTLETTGKGLVSMQQGDKLTIDGHEVVIGAGGNIGPQKLTIGNVKYTYEVKNGKFRIALNEWGVLEPNRIIPIKIVRNENGKEKSLAEHNLTIKAPRRVEGTSNVKLNQDYSIRNTIRFNGISLQGAGALGLENPIPLGVSLTSTAGQGIPFMKEGDRLEISDGLTTRSTYSTRGVKAFTIGPNGTLGKQQLKLNNGELTVFVEGGKLRVGVNNWLVNNTINSNVRLVRGTNEIMNHSLEIQVPNAPFNVKKNGLLDFGNVTAGSKRTAETDIVLEMLKDVSDVKFSLKDPQPILENLGTGDSLKVNRIEYLVSKQGKRDYKVKLKGNLTIPEATKSGLYTGSTVLELKIK